MAKVRSDNSSTQRPETLRHAQTAYLGVPMMNTGGAIVTIIDRSIDWLIMRKLPHGKNAFADPHAPWQKGGIENTNGLIRQYIPNGTDFNDVSQQRIKMIQRKINARPREKLNFITPDEVVTKRHRKFALAN